MSENEGATGVGPDTIKDIPVSAPGVSVVRAVAQRLGVEPNRQIRADVTPTPSSGSLQLGASDATQQKPPGGAGEPGGPSPARFNLEAHSDELVEVKVGNETVTVRVADAVQGYMRSADYTRKTQALSEERSKLESGIPEEEKKLLELGRKVASTPEAITAIREVLGGDDSDPETDTQRRLQRLEQTLVQRDQTDAARKNLEALVNQHPEAQDHLGDVVAEMKRTGSKDPVAAWRAIDYTSVPERIAETAEAERLKRADAASGQSVVNTPSGAASSSSGAPARESSGKQLSGRDFIRSLLTSG